MTYEEWKKQGEPYIGGLALLARLCPGHVLLPELQKGVTPLNKLYLKGALLKVRQFDSGQLAVSSTVVQSAAATTAPTKQLHPDCPLPTVELQTRLRLLMSERAKLRNTYHDYGLRNDVPAVQARITINRQLMDIRREIEDVSRKLEFGVNVGEVQNLADVATMIPEGEGDYAELCNLRSNVARQKAKLRKAMENKLLKEEIAAIELLLKQYETRRDIVAKKLKGK